MATVPDPRHGVFETLLVIDGRPVEFDAHLARLAASLEALFPDQTAPDLDAIDVGDGLVALRIAVAPDGNGELEAQIEWRQAPHGSAISLHSLTLAGGLGAHKWADRALLDEVKAGLPTDALPLIVDDDGTVLEASRANIFVVRDGVLVTPPTDGRILPGVTRMRVLEIADAAGQETREAALTMDDLLSADEVFLTGSIRGVERVRALDGIALPKGGEVGSPIAAELWRSWKSIQVG